MLFFKYIYGMPVRTGVHTNSHTDVIFYAELLLYYNTFNNLLINHYFPCYAERTQLEIKSM